MDVRVCEITSQAADVHVLSMCVFVRLQIADASLELSSSPA
jgi:hypothetical protein